MGKACAEAFVKEGAFVFLSDTVSIGCKKAIAVSKHKQGFNRNHLLIIQQNYCCKFFNVHIVMNLQENLQWKSSISLSG